MKTRAELARFLGVIRAVTCSQSDIVDEWRDRRADGEMVIDNRSGEIVASGFSMPHSSRLYQDRLWLLDSDNGFFGYVDIQTGKFEYVKCCPGYACRLSFVGEYTIVDLSRPRDGKIQN